MISGGADCKLVIWKDATEEEEVKKVEELREKVE